MMRQPKYAVWTMQDQLDGGLNAFALQLVAEAHADDPNRWGDNTVMVRAIAHNGTPVYMLISTQMPTAEQLATWPKPK